MHLYISISLSIHVLLTLILMQEDKQKKVTEGGNSHKWKFCSGDSLSRNNASPRGPEVFATLVTFKPKLKWSTV